MIKNNIIEYGDKKYKYLGNGCKATGANEGWRMSEDLYMRCIDCGYIMSANPHVDDSCSCGKLFKTRIKSQNIKRAQETLANMKAARPADERTLEALCMFVFSISQLFRDSIACLTLETAAE